MYCLITIVGIILLFNTFEITNTALGLRANCVSNFRYALIIGITRLVIIQVLFIQI